MHLVSSNTLTKGGLRLNLLSAPPPIPPVPPGTIHIRVAASLQPAKGLCPPATAWAMEVLKVARDGTQTTRLTARGAIAVTATHGAQGRTCLAAKHTKQVARQAAAHQALLCAEHLTSCALHRRTEERHTPNGGSGKNGTHHSVYSINYKGG